MFTGKVIISLLSYVHLKSFINGNADPVERLSHAVLYNALCFFHSFQYFTLDMYISNIYNHKCSTDVTELSSHHEFLFTHTVVSPEMLFSSRQTQS